MTSKREKEFKRMRDIIKEKTKYGNLPISERGRAVDVDKKSTPNPERRKKDS